MNETHGRKGTGLAVVVGLLIATTGNGATETAPTPTITARSAPMAKVFVRPLKYARASDVQNMMCALGANGTNLILVADDRAGTLTITTRPENMRFFDILIQVWDVEGVGLTNNLVKGCLAAEGAPEPSNAGHPTHMAQPYVLAVGYARATRVLELIWAGQEIDSIRSGTRIVADDRSGTLVVLTNPENMALVETLAHARDVEEGAPLNRPSETDPTTKGQQATPYSEPAARSHQR